VLQPLSGDLSARHVAEKQPIKLAAAEALWQTTTEAPLSLGGWADAEAEKTRWSIEVPYLLSVLAYHDPHAQVLGLKSVAKEDRPPVALVHAAFDIMVLSGFAMAAVALWLPGRPGEKRRCRLIV